MLSLSRSVSLSSVVLISSSFNVVLGDVVDDSLAAAHVHRKTAKAFRDLTALTVEGGGERTLLEALGFQRGMEMLKEKTTNFQLDPDIITGVSGGFWGAAALVYSRSRKTRVGKYTPPEKLTAENLKDVETVESKLETLSRFADASLESDTPVVGKDAQAAATHSGFYFNSLLQRGKDWWHFYAGWQLYAVDVDPLAEFSWCSKEDAEKAWNQSQIEAEASRSTASELYPALPKCQRPGAPFPIAVAADVTGFPHEDIEKTLTPAPAIEY